MQAKYVLLRSMLLPIILIIFNNDGNAQSIYFQQFDQIYFRKNIVTAAGEVIVTDGNSFYKQNAEGEKINNNKLNLGSGFLLKDMKLANNGLVYCLYQYSEGAGTNAGFVVSALDNSMNLKWMKSFSSSTGTTLGYSLSVASNNEIIICGSTCSTAFFILKLNDNGEQQFVKNITVNNYSVTPSVVTVINENIYCGLKLSSNNSYAAAILKLNMNGEILMGKKISFADNLYIKSIKTDETGKIYTLINSLNNSFILINQPSLSIDKLIKLDANASIQSNDFTIVNNNIYTVGNINPEGNSNLDIMMTSINTNGNLNWSKAIAENGLEGEGYDDALSVTNYNNYLMLCGTSSMKGFEAKVNASGNGFCNSSVIDLNVSSQNISAIDFAAEIQNDNIFIEHDISNYFPSVINSNSSFCNYEIISSVPEVTSSTIYSADEINIYPNPSNGNINISGINRSTTKQLIIVDIAGRIILTEKNINETMQIDGSKLVSGTYFINEVNQNGTNKSYKLIMIK